MSESREVSGALQGEADFEAGGANCSFREASHQDNDVHMIDLLASGVAHDFNNRLQSMASALNLIRVRVAAGRTSEVGALIDIAERSLDSAGKLAHRLMTVARKAPHQSDSIFHLNDALLSMSDLLRCIVGERIKLRLSLSDSATQIRCDSHLLECAIINLVINSRDAMPKGGLITIETSKSCSPEADDGQEYVSLCVTDSGCGIAPDVIQKVFEPFFTTKPRGVGTGLGLPMIRHFVDRARGQIEVHSTPQQGTCIKLYLPVAAES
ncbi:sensor histidine kinase [Bradyrhizobium sp. STM 3557]|uniref:sensor histidine kinase n=1 Tax=Bradyrhizobium sp. STM 3557 TaxID=578920 RepID=UPI00388DE112